MSKTLSHFRRIIVPVLLFLSGMQQAVAQNCTVNAGVPQTICITSPLVLSGTENGLFTGGNNYRWDKISGPSAVISSPTSASTAVTNLSAGVYTYRLSALCQDGVRAANDVTVTVIPDVTLPNAGPDQSVCVANNGTPLQLAANTPNAGASPAEVGSWTANPSSNASFSSITNPAATFTGSNGVAYNAIWSITNGYCTRRDTAVLSIVSGAATVNAGSSIVLNCNGSSANLNGSAIGLSPQSGLWSIVSGPDGATIANATSSSTTISNLVPGTYTLRYEVSGPCVNGFDTMQIVVQNTNSGPNTGGSTNIAPFCAGQGITSAVLNAPTPAANVVSAAWTQVSGPTTVTFGTPTSNTTTVNNLDGSGTYVFKYSASNGGCSGSSNYTLSYTQYVTNLPEPNPQVLNCGDSSANVPFVYTYGGSTNGTGLNRTATIVSQPSGANAVATLTQNNVGNEVWNVARMSKTGQYVVRFMWSTPCGSMTRDVSFYASFSAGAVNAGSDPVIVCGATQTTMSGNPPPAGVVGTWSQVSGPNQANNVTPNSPAGLMTGLIPGVYVFTWQLASGSSCFAPVDTAIAVVSSASVTPAVAGPDDSVCNSFPVQLAGNQPGISQVGTWTVTPAGGVFNNVNIPNAQVTGLAPHGTYHFVWTITNACDTSRDTVVIKTGAGNTQTVVSAGADQCRPAGTTSISLSGSATGGSTPTWVALDGGTIASPNSRNTTVSVPGNGTYRFVYSMSYPVCSSMGDTVTVQISPSATVANAGANQTVCMSGVPASITLTGNTPTQGTPVWSLVNGLASATIASPNSASTTAGNLYAGVYFFEYKIANGVCPASRDTVRVLLNEPPSTAQASTTTPTFCNTNSGTIQLNAVAPTVGMGMWSLLSAPANSPTVTINNSTSTNATVDVSTLVTGIYKFKYMVANGPSCTPSVDSVEISVVRPASAIGASTVNLCNVTSTILTGAANTTGTWTVASTPMGAPTPTITTLASGFQATADNLVQGAYSFTYTTDSLPGCPGTSTTRPYLNGTPATASNAGPDQFLCSNVSTVSLSGNASVGGAAWTKVSGPNNGSAGTANSNYQDTTVNSLNQGIHVFRYTTRGTGSCPTETDDIQVVRERTANAGTDKAICEGPTTALSANVPYYYTANWTQVSGPTTATIANAAAPNTGIGNLIPGIYSFRYEIYGPMGCSVNADTVVVKVDSAVTYHAGPDTSICVGSPSFTIGTTAEAGVSYAWTPATALSANNIAQPTFSPATEGTYNYLVKATRGTCKAQDDIKIVVKPSAITPTFTVPAPICGPGARTVSVSNADPATTYTWFDASNNNVGTGTSLSVTPGTYTVSTVRDGCTGGTGTFTLNFKPIPDSAEFNVPAPVCANATGTVSISNAISGATYSWSGGYGNGTSKNVAPGTYTVSVTKNGCTGPTGSFTLGSKPIPDSAEFTVPAPVCADATGTVSISNPIMGAVYTWSGGNGTGTSKTLAPGTYTVSVNLNGCAGANGTFTLGSKPVPDSAQFNAFTPPCGNGSVNVSIASPIMGAVYTWSNGLGTGTSKSVMPGTYTVAVNLNGCEGDTATVAVGTRPIPSAAFTQDENCKPTFTVTTPTAGATYTWDFGAGATPANYTGMTPTQGPVVYSPLGSKTVTLIVTSAAGCADTFSHTFQALCTPPVAALAVNIADPCLGTAVTFTNNTVIGDTPMTYSYNFGDGSPLVTTPNATYTYTTPGTYTVTFTVTNPSGSSTATTMVTVKPVPNTNFTINQNPQNFTGNLFTFNALGPATNLYAWDFGDGSIGQYATVSRSYSMPGMYPVTLKVTDVVNGCIAYRTQVVTVLSDSVSPGNQGGIESESLGGLVTRRNFNRLKYSLNPAVVYQNLPMFEKATAPDYAASKGTGSQELTDMIPANLQAGDVPRVSTPTDLTTLTIAREVMAVDYTRENVNKAVVLGIKTENRAYNHTKSICDRFRGSTLLNIEPITLRGMNFSRFSLLRENGLLEYAIAFDAGVTPGTDQYRVQGDWVIASYAGDKSVYNFQVWAASPADVEKLALDVLDKQASYLPLQRYTSGVTVPDVYVTKGVRQKDQLLLTVRNNGAATTATMNFKVQMKEDGSMTDMEVAVPLKAKTDTVVSLTIGDNYEFDGLMRTSDNILKDQFYLADGNWGLDYDQSLTSLKEWVPANDPNRVYTDNSLPLYRKVNLTAVSTDYLTLYKAIKPGTEPTDLSSYSTLKFHAAGQGKATVRITREGITKWDDQYQTEITLTKDGADYAIPFSDFTSAANPSVALSPKDAKTLSFTMSNTSGKAEMIELAVRGAEFSKDIVQSPKLMASRNLKIAPNPTKGPFTVTFGSDAARSLTLTVSDLTGRVIMTKEVSATVGSNTVAVNPTGDLPTGTILLVSLRNNDVRYNEVKVSVQ